MEAPTTKREAALLTLEDVAECLRVHRSTVYRMVKKNQLPAFKFGGEWRFNRESIERWRVDAQQNVSGDDAIPGTGAKARVQPSHSMAASPEWPANRLKSTSQARRPRWSGWPRLTDP